VWVGSPEQNSTDIGCCWVRDRLTQPTPDYFSINMGSINHVHLGDRYFHELGFLLGR